MITVDINDHAEVFAAGCRLLYEGLGADAANVFLNLSRGESGDWTKEKYDRPDMTDAEYSELMDEVKAEAVEAGTWE
jgi:hypothetical protein